MEEIAPEYDVVVLGTGQSSPAVAMSHVNKSNITSGLTECVLSGYETAFRLRRLGLISTQCSECQRKEGLAHRPE